MSKVNKDTSKVLANIPITHEMIINDLDESSGWYRCSICGEPIDPSDTLKDGSSPSFILFVKDDARAFFKVHKKCYLNHHKVMSNIINHYKEEFFLEDL